MSNAIALFAKAPRAGRVKTRLYGVLTPEDAAALQQAFVLDVWNRLRELAAAVYLYSDIAWKPYQELAGPESARLQRGDDLGDKMFHCFQELARRGHERVLIVGSDSPTLPGGYLRNGLEMLETADAILGPAEDGGYYAVGCRRGHPDMFQGVTWSSAETRQRTEAAFRRAGLSVRFLPNWYDVDTVEDLRRLAADPALPPRTRAWFAERPELAAEIGFSGG